MPTNINNNQKTCFHIKSSTLPTLINPVAKVFVQNIRSFSDHLKAASERQKHLQGTVSRCKTPI